METMIIISVVFFVLGLLMVWYSVDQCNESEKLYHKAIEVIDEIRRLKGQ